MSKTYVFYGEKGDPFLIRCPRCERENWTMAVATGVCCWCQYKAPHKDKGEKPDVH